MDSDIYAIQRISTVMRTVVLGLGTLLTGITAFAGVGLLALGGKVVLDPQSSSEGSNRRSARPPGCPSGPSSPLSRDQRRHYRARGAVGLAGDKGLPPGVVVCGGEHLPRKRARPSQQHGQTRDATQETVMPAKFTSE